MLFPHSMLLLLLLMTTCAAAVTAGDITAVP
jgi:hypothetical protein